jgi:hypothetical protein
MIRRFSTAAATQAWVAPLTSVPGAVLQIRTARNAPRPQGGSGMVRRNVTEMSSCSRTWSAVYG